MSFCIEPVPGIALLAFPRGEALLDEELAARFSGFPCAAEHRYGLLRYLPDAVLPLADNTAQHRSLPYWCQTELTTPFLLHFDSITDAATALKSMQRNWAPYQYQLFRRAALIQEKLPFINGKPRRFPTTVPRTPMGLYTLIDEHTIVASAETTSFLPAGAIAFAENHDNPPSRAYLKLWEALTMAEVLLDAAVPAAGAHCFDGGAAPGGWTWALIQLGCTVYAVDRTELTPALMRHPRVTFQAHDAFTIPPEAVGSCDWVCSDVICYPERLYRWIQRWLQSGLAKNMICTIKLHGKTDWALIAAFAAIPGSRVVHLNYNKHELTWLYAA